MRPYVLTADSFCRGTAGYVLRGERYRTPEEEDIEEAQGDTPVDYFGKALLASGGFSLEDVRATGPIDSLTHQPVQGRKRHGGVRFGEMERDALIAHGAAALLQDRLLHCSDAHRAFCCPACGSILSPAQTPDLKGRSVGGKKLVPCCCVCNVPCRLVQLPYVFRYLSNELAAMNVTVRLELEHMGAPVQIKQQLFDADSTSAMSLVKKENSKQAHHGSENKRQEPRQACGHTA
ncbi:hypothetical protein ACSSS7_003258 [Eimeria intestinalis]